MKKKQSINSKSLLILAVLILINLISFYFYFRIDLTEDGIYSLSKASRNILKSLDETVTVSAYFTEDLPPALSKTKSDFKDMLIEYNSASKGNVVYEFINPNADQETEAKAFQEGIRPVIINLREKDQVKQQKVYLGAVIRMGEEKDIIPLVQPGSAMEYDLSASIKKLSIVEKPKIGWLQGHGEPGLAAMVQAGQQLSILYDVVPVNLRDTSMHLPDYKTIAIVAPRDSIHPYELMMLDQYLAQGGNLFVGINRVDGNMQQAQGVSLETGLEQWLAGKGIMVENSFIIDASCGNISVRQQQMGFTFNTNIPFPYLPIVTNFTDHPITKGLESVLFPFASPIVYTGDTSIQFVPIATSSKNSGYQATPFMFDVNKKWTDADFTFPNQVMAAIISGNISGNAYSNMIVVGDGNFAVNGEGQQAQQL
ncbi:MAG: GldG family protein, partial [Bacteroidota bacterium]|nr:GldG family protein [Bacteroidota bacterium]